MRLHSRVTYLSTEWEVLAIYDSGVLLKSLNKNVENRFVESSSVKHLKQR